MSSTISEYLKIIRIFIQPMLRIRDVYPDPDFIHTRIQQKQKKGNFFVLSFFVVKNLIKIENYFISEKKKKLSQFIKNYSIFTQKIVTGLSKIWFDIRDPRKNSGSWIRGSKRKRISVPQHCQLKRITRISRAMRKNTYRLKKITMQEAHKRAALNFWISFLVLALKRNISR
jgi:hypothetical protein